MSEIDISGEKNSVFRELMEAVFKTEQLDIETVSVEELTSMYVIITNKVPDSWFTVEVMIKLHSAYEEGIAYDGPIEHLDTLAKFLAFENWYQWWNTMFRNQLKILEDKLNKTNKLQKQKYEYFSRRLESLLSTRNLKLIIDHGSATPEEIADILSDLSLLYRLEGGSGIDFSLDDVYHVTGVNHE